MKRDLLSAGAVQYRLVVAVLLIGSLAGCSVSGRARPQPPAEDFSALAPILVPDLPYALSSVPITPENADRVALVGEVASRGLPLMLASAPDGRVLAVGTSRGIYLHDAQTLEQQRFLEAPARAFVSFSPFVVSFSPDGRRLAAYAMSVPHQVRVWRLDDGALVGSLDLQKAGTTIYPTSLAFSADGEQLYAGYYNLWWEHTILAWRPESESAGRKAFQFDLGSGWKANVVRLIIAPAHDLVVFALFGKVEVHRLSQPQRLFAVEASPEEVRSAALSPNGRRLAIAFTGPKLQLWDLPAGKLLRELPISGKVLAAHLEFSPDGQRLIGALDNNVYIWSLDRAEAAPDVVALERNVKITNAQFSPDPAVIHVLLADGLRNVRIANGTAVRAIGEYLGRLHGIAFSADGRWLAGAFDHQIALWRVQDGALLRTTAPFASELSGFRVGDLALSGPAPVADAVFSPDLHAAIYSILGDLTIGDERGRGGSVQVRGADGALRQTLSGYVNVYARLAISPDGRFLAGGDKKGVVLLWRLSDGLNVRVLRGHREAIVGLAFSPDNRLLVTAGSEESVKVWDVASGRERQVVLRNAGDARIAAIALSPTGRRLAVLTKQSFTRGGVAFWEADEVGSFSFVRALDVEGMEINFPLLDRPSVPIAFSPDGALLAIANDKLTYLVDAEQALLKRVLNTDEDAAALAFSPDGRLLALATENGRVLLYGVPRGERVRG
jgi:WD40 repeat protein